MKKLRLVFLFVCMVGFALSLPGQGNLSAASLELVETAGDGDLAHVQQLLAQGADVNAQDLHGFTPLINAARMGDGKTVKLLLDKGARIDWQAQTGGSALMWALRGAEDDQDMNRQVPVVQLLLARGADARVKDAQGTTALMLAAESGVLQSVQLLLARGADVNARNSEGKTALRFAKGHPAVARLLRAHGAHQGS